MKSSQNKESVLAILNLLGLVAVAIIGAVCFVGSFWMAYALGLPM